MPEYLSPGVYIEEVPTGPVPIQGVSTSTTGFVGATERGPTQAKLVTSWMDFQRWYGGVPDDDELANYGYLSWSVQGFFLNGGQRAFISRVVNEDKQTAANNAKTATIAGSALGVNDLPALSAIGPGAFGANVYLQLTRASQNDDAPNASNPARADWFALSIVYYRGGLKITGGTDPASPDLPENLTNVHYRQPAAREFFDNLSPNPASQNFFIKVLNAGSKLVTVSDAAVSSYDPARASRTLTTYLKSLIPTKTNTKKPKKYAAMSLPANTPSPDKLPVEQDYIGTGDESTPPEQRTGLQALKPILDISLLCVPDCQVQGNFANLAQNIVEQCTTTKSRFCILNYSQTAGATDITALVPPIDTTYGAIYYPWITVQNPESGRLLKMPSAGYMAGVYARTDSERGVHKAPANEILLGPILNDVANTKPLYPNVTRGQQDILNPKNVNCIRDFRPEGRGIRVWGARTMSSDGQWRYVNVRRLFIFVEQSVDRGTQWVVFEPNDQYTWERVISSVSGFLNTVWRNGALMGTTPQEAYFVRCDRSTMSQDDIDNGRLVCVVGIAPVKPAEFVIFRFQQKTADSES